jgi:hypothetical protein
MIDDRKTQAIVAKRSTYPQIYPPLRTPATDVGARVASPEVVYELVVVSGVAS